MADARAATLSFVLDGLADVDDLTGATVQTMRVAPCMGDADTVEFEVADGSVTVESDGGDTAEVAFTGDAAQGTVTVDVCR